MSDFVPGDRVIRPSSLTTETDCARRWAAIHYAPQVMAAGFHLRERALLHVGAAVGSGVHAAAHFTLDAKRRTGELGNAREAEDRAEAEFLHRAEYGLNWDETTDRLPTAQEQMRRMTRAYRRYLAPDLVPIAVEQRLDVDVGDGWVLSGQADALAGDPDADLRDLKTGVRRRPNGVQYASYHVIFTAHGFRPHDIIEDFVQRVRLKNEQPPPVSQVVPLDQGMADAWQAIEDIKAGTATFDARVASGMGAPAAAFRANPQSQLCSDRWCPAWGTDFCRSHLGAK